MAFVTLGSELAWPRAAFPQSARLDFQSMNVWSVTPKLAFVCVMPKSGTLDKVEFRMEGGATTMRVSFQAVSGNAPAGTQQQYRDYAPVNGWVVPGLLTSDGTDSGTKRTVTKGDVVAVVWEYPGTVGDQYLDAISANEISTSGYQTGQASDGYLIFFQSGAWASAALTYAGMSLALKYSDGSYGRFLSYHVPLLNKGLEAFGSADTPDERGLYFTTTVPLRVTGAWLVLDQDAAADVVLYATNGSTVLASVSATGPRGTTREVVTWLRFSSDVDLPVGTGYRLVVKPTTTSTVGLYVLTLADTAHREAYPGGLACQYTSRTDAGAWTQTGTKLAQIGLMVSGLDDGTGGGGGGGSPERAHTFVGVAG